MSVAKKIVLVMKDVGMMSKDKRLEGGGSYKYLSEEKVTSELHQACAKHGVAIAPSAMTILEERQDTTKAGAIMHNVRIAASYRIMDADEPESFVEVQVLGEGSDMGDKVLNKAMTAAFKYALRQSFMISSGDDPDHTASEEATSSRPVQRAADRPVAPGQGRLGWSKVMERLANIPGALEDDAEGRPKPSRKGFHALNVSGMVGKWNDKEPSVQAEILAALDKVIADMAEEQAAQPELPVATDPPETVDDPFANE